MKAVNMITMILQPVVGLLQVRCKEASKFFITYLVRVFVTPAEHFFLGYEDLRINCELQNKDLEYKAIQTIPESRFVQHDLAHSLIN